MIGYIYKNFSRQKLADREINQSNIHSSNHFINLFKEPKIVKHLVSSKNSKNFVISRNKLDA